jgi:hypothetical protein
MQGQVQGRGEGPAGQAGEDRDAAALGTQEGRQRHLAHQPCRG